MAPDNEVRPTVLLDAPERPRVAVPLLPELAVVSTLVLIAAPLFWLAAACVDTIKQVDQQDVGGEWNEHKRTPERAAFTAAWVALTRT